MRKRVFLACLLAVLALAAAAGALLRESASLNAGNGYRWEKKFRAAGPVSVAISLEPADAPVDAFLYLGGGDEPVARASGRGSLRLEATPGGDYTLALVGARRADVRATIAADGP